MIDRLSPEEAWVLIEKTMDSPRDELMDSERAHIVYCVFNYPLIEEAAEKVIECWGSGDIAGAMRKLDAVIKNPFTGYKQ